MIRIRRDDTNPELIRIKKRVEKLSIRELLDWADIAGSGMSKALNDYRHLGTKESLDEIDQGLLALKAVADDLRIRAEVFED